MAQITLAIEAGQGAAVADEPVLVVLDEAASINWNADAAAFVDAMGSDLAASVGGVDCACAIKHLVQTPGGRRLSTLVNMPTCADGTTLQLDTSRSTISEADVPASDATAHYLFGEGAGLTLGDLTANGYDGTLTNSPTWGTTSIGPGLEFTGTAHVLLPMAVGTAMQSAGTLLIGWKHDGVNSWSGGGGHFLDDRAGGNAGWDIFFGNGVDFNEGRMGLIVDTGGQGSTSLPLGSLSAALHAGAFTWANPVIDCYLDAVEASFTGSQSGTATPSSQPKLGNQVNDGDPFGANRYMVEAIVYPSDIGATRIGLWSRAVATNDALWSDPEAVGGAGAVYRPWLITGGRLR